MFLHLASLLHIKIHKNAWAHEGSKHNPRICSFGYVRDYYLQWELNKDLKANKFQG
jgi:hypothetical protein